MPRVWEEDGEQPRLVSVESVEDADEDVSPGGFGQHGQGRVLFEERELEELGMLETVQQYNEGNRDSPEQIDVQDANDHPLGQENEAVGSSVRDPDGVELSDEGVAGGSSTSARKRPSNLEGTDGNPRTRPPPPPKKAKTPAEFIDKYEARVQKALRSGRTLERMVEEYQVTTGAKVYFKGLFKYKNGHELTLQAGEDFNLPDQTRFSLEDANESMRATVMQTISNLVRPSPGPSTSSTTSAFSPSVNAPQRLDPCRCRLCGKKEVSEGLIVFPSEWIKCNMGTDCNFKVHVDCLGFPGVNRGQLRNFPKFYCQRHRQVGRQREGLQPAFAGSADVNEDVTEPPARGRGRGRGERAGRTRRGRSRGSKT